MICTCMGRINEKGVLDGSFVCEPRPYQGTSPCYFLYKQSLPATGLAAPLLCSAALAFSVEAVMK